MNAFSRHHRPVTDTGRARAPVVARDVPPDKAVPGAEMYSWNVWFVAVDPTV
jgi:hypothetical protein